MDSFCLLGNVSSWTHKGTKGKLSDTLGIFPIYVIPIPCLLIVWGFLCYTNMSVACILRPVGPMGSHFLVCSWMLGKKADKILWRRKITVYWKFSVEGGVLFLLYLSLGFLWVVGVFCYVIKSNIFCSISELPYFSICWNDEFHTFFCEVREIERKYSQSLMIKILSVEALHYSTFQNRKDKLFLQWHKSNLKLESIALPTLNTKDVHCLQTEFFLSVCVQNQRPYYYFFPLEKPLQWKNCSWFCASHPGLQEGFLLHSVISS